MEEAVQYMKCLHCSGEVTPDSDFCPHCGSLLKNAESVPCWVHPHTRAVAVCVICRKAFCRECGRKKSGRWLCTDHKDVKVEQDWALIFESPDINEAELVKSVLESVGQRVVVRNFGPNNVVWEGGGDSLFSRQALNRPAKVFVPVPEYENAKITLDEWQSSRISSADK